ncbi:MAG: HAD family hydrolase, partial [Bacillota bacterium]|nr:HAD family hydrolase [Bacillota bacterium]
MIKLCVFDMDGTLVDSIADIAAAMNHILSLKGYPTHPSRDYRLMVGAGMKVLCQKALPEGSREEQEALYEAYYPYYAAHCCDRTRPFEGMEDTLSRLREAGVCCAILSNKPHEITACMAEIIFPPGSFALVLGNDARFPRKPEPDALLYIIKELGFRPEETAYVGDTKLDVQVAANAGTACISCAWGLRTVEELREAGASFLAYRPEDIAEWVL